MTRTKIVATLGPASVAPEVLAGLVEAGMRVARINCSHGTPEEHAAHVQLVRDVSAQTGIPVAVLYDLSGPKVRTGTMDAPIDLPTGGEITLTARADRAPSEVPLGFTALPGCVTPGQHILLDDGSLELEVLRATETDIVCRVLVGGPLGSHKGINLPGATLPIPAVTDKDLADLRQGLQLGVDWIAMSFVRTPEDLQPVRALMTELGITRPVIAKIEKHEAIDNLDAIIEAFDGIMVARGDLGLEVSLERIPLLQKEIIRKANHAGKPVITATQMLDSMIRNPRPTRAEVTDVANAILDGTDAVMLSGETSVGLFPLETVRTMNRVAEWAETLLPDNAVPTNQAPHYDHPTGALAASAVDIAEHLHARAIVTVTAHGHTATLVSKSRPTVPVLALTGNRDTYTQLPLLWGVTPLYVEPNGSEDEAIDRAVRDACRLKLLANGDLLVIVAVAHQPVGVVTRASEVLRIATIRR